MRIVEIIDMPTAELIDSVAARAVGSLSHRERGGVRGCGLTSACTPPHPNPLPKWGEGAHRVCRTACAPLSPRSHARVRCSFPPPHFHKQRKSRSRSSYRSRPAPPPTAPRGSWRMSSAPASAARSWSRTRPAPAARSACRWSRSPRPTATRWASARAARCCSTRTCRSIPGPTCCAISTPVAKIIDIAIVLVANATSGPKTIQEMIARSKATPGGLTYGSTGANTSQHISIELLKQATGANLVHVPYRGSAPAVVDVLAGQIPLASVDLTSAYPHIQSGRLIALGLADSKRFPVTPEIPTIAEGGVPGFGRASGFIGLFAPAGTPSPVVRKISREGRGHSRNARRAGHRPDPDFRRGLSGRGGLRALSLRRVGQMETSTVIAGFVELEDALRMGYPVGWAKAPCHSAGPINSPSWRRAHAPADNANSAGNAWARHARKRTEFEARSRRRAPFTHPTRCRTETIGTDHDGRDAAARQAAQDRGAVCRRRHARRALGRAGRRRAHPRTPHRDCQDRGAHREPLQRPRQLVTEAADRALPTLRHQALPLSAHAPADHHRQGAALVRRQPCCGPSSRRSMPH